MQATSLEFIYVEPKFLFYCGSSWLIFYKCQKWCCETLLANCTYPKLLKKIRKTRSSLLNEVQWVL